MITTMQEYPKQVMALLIQSKTEIIVKVAPTIRQLAANAPIEIRSEENAIWIEDPQNTAKWPGVLSWKDLLLSSPSFTRIPVSPAIQVGRWHVKNPNGYWAKKDKTGKLRRRFVKCQTCGRMIDRATEHYADQHVYDGTSPYPIGEVFYHRQVECLPLQEPTRA